MNATIPADAPRNVVKLAGIAEGAGYAVTVARTEGAAGWVMVATGANHGTTGTGRYVWEGSRWSRENAYGFKYVCEWLAANPAAPAEAPAEAPAVPADAEATAVTAGGVIVDAGKEAQERLSEARSLVTRAESLKAESDEWSAEADAAVTTAEAERCAEECARVSDVLGLVKRGERDADGKRPASGLVKDAAAILRKIIKLRKVIADTSRAVAGDAGMESVFDHWHSATVDAEGEAREALGTVEECADDAEATADAAAGYRTCIRCGLILTGDAQRLMWDACGCRAIMAATLADHGRGYQDAEDVRIGRLLTSDSESLAEAGQLALCGMWDASADMIAEAERFDSAEVPADVRPAPVDVVSLPGAAEAAEAEREHARRTAVVKAQHAERLRVRAEAVPGPLVRVVRKGAAPVDVQGLGYSERCWSHCPEECPGWEHAEDCTCEARPVVGIDGPSEPYGWEDCAECAASLLSVPVAEMIAAGTATAEAPADAARLAEDLYEDAAEREAESLRLKSEADALDAEAETRPVADWEPECVAQWRSDAVRVMGEAVALAQWAEAFRGGAAVRPAPVDVDQDDDQGAPVDVPAEAPAVRLAASRTVRLAELVARAEAAEHAAGVLRDMAAEAGRWADAAPVDDVSADRAAEAAAGRYYAAEDRARSARVTADLLAKDAERTAEHVARARGAADAIRSRTEGRRVFESADGRCVMSLAVPESYPSPEAEERTEAFAGALAAVVAAHDAGKPVTATMYGKQARGYPGPGADMKRAVTRAGQPLVSAWKAPRIPAEGKALDGKALAALDADGVCAETETAPGVWLPRAAVLVAETAEANGWAVAMERRALYDGRALVVVRTAGTMTRKRTDGESVRVTGECVGVWTDGLYDVQRSGAFARGARLSAPLDKLCQQVAQVADAATITTGGEPAPAVRPDAGPSDPGAPEAWESDGGALDDGPAGPSGDCDTPPATVTQSDTHDVCVSEGERHPGADPMDSDGRAPYANGFTPAVLDGYEPADGADGYEWAGWWCDTDCGECATGTECADCLACTSFAAPYPAHWARDERPGEPYRGVEIFGGPGGMSAARSLVDQGGEWVLIEFNRDAADTSRAAGHWVICADVRTLDPRHPVLRKVRRFHGSPPCQTLSTAGQRSAWNSAEIAELQSIMWQASEAFGFLEVDDLCSLYGGPHGYHGDPLDDYDGEHPDEWGTLCGGGYLPPCMTPDAYREWAAGEVSDDRTALMVEMLIWPMCMVQNGAPLESVTLEQSPNLIRQTPALAEALQSEFLSVEGFGWSWCSWQIADAADTGAASHRERAWMIAKRDGAPRYATAHPADAAAQMWGHIARRTGSLPDGVDAPELSGMVEPYQGRAPLPVVTMAQALDIPADWYADTRGKRGVNKRTGVPLGGGSFPVNTVAQCVTAPWYGVKFRPADAEQGSGTRVITREEMAVLVGFPRDYPWQYTPTRKGAKGTRNVAQMIADSVSRFMSWVSSAVNEDAADWYEPTAAYQAELYRTGGEGGTVALPDSPPVLSIPGQRPPLAIESGSAPSRLQITGGTPVQLAICAAPPATGRAYWEPGERVTLDGRAGRTWYSDLRHGVRVVWDDKPNGCEYADPRTLWAEGTEPAPARVIAPPYMPPARVFALPGAPVPPPVATVADTEPTPDPCPPVAPVIDDGTAARWSAIVARLRAEESAPADPEPTPDPVPSAPVARRIPSAPDAPEPRRLTDAEAESIRAALARMRTPDPDPDPAPVAAPVAAPVPVADVDQDDQDHDDRPTVGARVRTLAGWYGPALVALLLLAVLGAPVWGGAVGAVLALVPRLAQWHEVRKAEQREQRRTDRREGGTADHDLAA